MATLSIEERLAAVEAELGELKKHIVPNETPWERLAGAFENDPIFDSAMRRGEEYRRSLINDDESDVPA
jgi:hypothetical protein